MYCGNCGKQIDDNTAYCPECGAPMAPTATGKSFSKKHLRTGIIILLAMVIVGILGKTVVSIMNRPTKNEMQLNSNNLQNEGLIATDGKWIYYTSDDGISKEKLKDGKNQSIVVDGGYGEQMFCLGNKLYFYNFPFYNVLKRNQSDGTELDFSSLAEDCFQFTGTNYYITGYWNYSDQGVYEVDANKTDRASRISDISPTTILTDGSYLYVISNFSSINDLPNENYGTWRMDFNGKNLIKILNTCPDYLILTDDLIYFTDEDHRLCSMFKDGSNEQVFSGVRVGNGLNIGSDYIFYVDRDTDRICRLDIDGSDKTEMNRLRGRDINIAGDWIIFKDYDNDDHLTKMSFEGDVVQLLG